MSTQSFEITDQTVMFFYVSNKLLSRKLSLIQTSAKLDL